MAQPPESMARRLAALGLLVLAVSGSAAISPARGFKFAWLSDTHVGSDFGADDLRAVVADINGQPDLDFVILSGDITETGFLENFRRAKEILDGLAVPYHILPGNHDMKWSGSGGADFARVWGNDRFDFTFGGLRFLGLSEGPPLRMADGHWAPQDLRWLDAELGDPSAPQPPLVFVTHYPLDASIANGYEVLARLKRSSARLVLVGHGHRNRAVDFEGLPGVMSRSILRSAGVPAGYTIVEVDRRVMAFRERAAGGGTGPVWHTVGLGRRIQTAREAGWPRPDFSVNDRYPGVRTRWSFATGWTISSSAALSDGTAIVGDASGTVRAFRIADGAIAWEFRAGGAVLGTPAAADGRVLFGAGDGQVYALDSASGRRLWTFLTEAPLVACPLVADGVVYIGGGDGAFRALDAASGRLLWRFDGLGGFVETRPLLIDGLVVFGAWDRNLRALDAKTGRLAWSWQGDRPGLLYSPAGCWPVGASGRVFIVAPDRRLTALDAATGREIWRTDRWPVWESIGLSPDGSRFTIRTMKDVIATFPVSSNEPRPVWESNAGFGYDFNPAMPAEKDGTIFYGTKNGLLLALDAATGAVKWRHRIGVALLSTPVPLGPREVLVTDFDGRVTLVEADR